MEEFKETTSLNEWIQNNQVGEDEVSLLSNFPNFKVEIVDGVMCISPSEAGVALFSYIQLNAKDKKEQEEMNAIADSAIERLAYDNAKLRDLCERMIEFFDDLDEPNENDIELKEELLKIVYPITATNTDGDEVKFEGEVY